MAMRLTEPNLAGDRDIARWVEMNIFPQLAETRQNRGPLDRKVERWFRMWANKRQRLTYTGRNNIRLAAGRKIIETTAKSIKAGFFVKSGEWFSTLGIEDVTTEEMAAGMQAVQEHWVKKMMKFERQFLPGARQLCIAGTNPMQHAWSEVDRVVKALKTEKARDGEKVKTRIALETIKLAGPTFRNCSFFDWFLWPETVEEIELATGVFEDREVPKFRIRDMAKRDVDPERPELGKFYENVDLALNQDALPAAFKEERKRRLRDMGIVNDPVDRWRNMPTQNCALTQLWWTGEIPDARDPDTGDEFGVQKWLIAGVGDMTCIRVQPNPFWKKTIPHHAARIIRMPEEFYGHSLCEAFDSIVDFMNDMANQTADAMQMTMNPVAIVDPNRHTRPNTMVWAPRARWLAPLDAVRFDRPPDVTDTGFRAVAFLQSTLHDYGGPPSILQGQTPQKGRGRIAQSAEGLSLLAGAGQNDLQEFLEEMDTVGEDILQRNAEYGEQFSTDEMVLTIAGRRGAPLTRRILTLADVHGEYVYKWRGSLATRQAATLAQSMTRMGEFLVRIPPSPDFKVRFDRYATRIWSDVFGMDNAHEIFESAETQLVVDPQTEHRLVELNRPIKVQPGENLLEHLTAHIEALEKFATKPDEYFALQEHIKETFAALQKQAEQMQQMAAMAAMGGGGGGGARPGTPGGGALPPPSPTGSRPGDVARQMQ